MHIYLICIIVPSAPVDVTPRVMSEYYTWMILSWQIPNFPNGKIKEYVIRYIEKDNAGAAFSIWTKVNTAGSKEDLTLFLFIVVLTCIMLKLVFDDMI